MRIQSQLSFFTFISTYFGFTTTKHLKRWIKHNRDLIKLNVQIWFLVTCKKRHILPRHLSSNNCYSHVTFSNHTNRRKFENKRLLFANRILRLEIDDLYKQRKMLTHEIHKINKFITNTLPSNLYSSFFITQSNSLHRFYIQHNDRITNKIYLLEQRSVNLKRESTHQINLKYYAIPNTLAVGPSTSRIGHNSYKFMFDKPHTHDTQYSIEVLATQNISDTPPLLEPRNNWFINLSNIDIPVEVQGLLQLGEGFRLPVTDNKEYIITEYIKHIENNIKSFNQTIKSECRNLFIPTLEKLKNTRLQRTVQDIHLMRALSTTKRFVRDNPKIMFTRADKGNSVVALDRDDYVHKMELLLTDVNTYSLLKNNPINKVLSSLKELLKRWKMKSYISDHTHNHLNTSLAILPRAYGVPKIHKHDNPLRIIISSVNSPLHNLAEFLHKIIHKSLPTSSSYVKDSFHLANILSSVKYEHYFDLISLDVVSLFTNVPRDLAIQGITNRWTLLRDNTKIPEEEFLIALTMIYDSTFFTFNNKFYKQIFGAPMGSPLSPILADIVLQDIESSALNILSFTPPFYVRYVDDIALMAPRDQFDNILKVFNSFHHRIQFTIDVGINDRLDFLDLTIIKTNDVLIYDWYHKPSFSGRYLNFYSNHPHNQKRGTAFGLIDRAFFLSHPQFHSKNLNLVINILVDNNYPPEFISETCKQRLKFNFFKNNDFRQFLTSSNDRKTQCNRWFTFPYIKNFSEELAKKVPSHVEARTTFTALDNLSKFIKVHKDPTPLLSRPNVVYKINCKDCQASYVGQTGRMLATRIKEHRSHINRNTNSKSVITEHRLTCSHEFDWDNVMVLDTEPSYHKRLISEMIYIKKQSEGLNMQSDTDLLDSSYLPIVDKR